MSKEFEVKVNDKRGRDKESKPLDINIKPDTKKEEVKKTQPSTAEQKEAPMGPITFQAFILSLASSAMIGMGVLADPETQVIGKNLPIAKQQIDLIGILEEKTQGNLTKEEKEMMQQILHELRLRFVEASK